MPFWVVAAEVSCITPFTTAALPCTVQPLGSKEKLLLKISVLALGLLGSFAETV